MPDETSTFPIMPDGSGDSPLSLAPAGSDGLYRRVIQLTNEIARDEEFIKRLLVELLDRHELDQARGLLVAWLANPPRVIVAKLMEDADNEGK